MATQTTEERLDAARAQLARPWAESEERTVEAGAFPITVRKRGNRYDLDDGGEAIASARALGASPLRTGSRSWRTSSRAKAST
jgi:hypothetical protein